MPVSVKEKRVPLSLSAFVVLAILLLVLGPLVIWGVLVVMAPEQVSANPPGSEAVTISAITGLVGWLGGKADGERAEAVRAGAKAAEEA